MSKVSRDNKKAEAAGKSKKTKSAVEKNSDGNKSILNFGKCCTCRFYGKPCHKTGEYVARKNEKCPVDSYKCKTK